MKYMAKQPTIPVNVVDKSIPADDHSLIAIIEEPNPVTGYEINEQQLRQLIQLPQYWITDENGRTISGVNFYEYFPRGGGGRLPIVIEKTITENGVYMAVDDHADGYSKVTVNTPVAPPPPVLIEKTITENGTYLPSDDDADGYSKVNVEIPGTTNPVKFIDYDGTVIASYTPTEFANLSAMPANPTHEGLIAQGWNWSLADAKTYVNKYGSLNIGQMYVTDDGKTRFYITLTEGRISPILQLYLNDNSELDIDWGDGSTHSTFTGSGYQSERHNYATAGDYVIAITVTTGSFNLQSSSSYYVSSILWNGETSSSSPNKAYNNSIKKIEIGTGVTTISTQAFYCCYSLSSITIPNGVATIGQQVFQGCYSLTSITIPDKVTTINNSFQNCYSLQSITIPDTVTSIGNSAFNQCYSLQSITIPDTVTGIGSNAFGYCTSLSSVTIGSGVTSIGDTAFVYCNSLSSVTIGSGVTTIDTQAFYGCYSLQSITIPDTVASIGSNAFNSCYSLSSVTIGSGVTNIGQSAFQGCSSLTTITIPDSVTSIGNNAFNACYSLASVTIGSGVTSIGSSAFQDCKYLESIKFKPTTPPTVSNSNAWTNLPTTCKIYVPSASLNTYKYATNYPSSSRYTYIGY